MILFLGGLMESQLSEIKMHVHDEQAFSEIIDYFYSSRIDIKDTNVQDYIPIAGMLQLKRLQQACCDFMKRNIDAQNCLSMFVSCFDPAGTQPYFNVHLTSITSI